MADWIVQKDYKGLEFSRYHPLGGITPVRHNFGSFLTKFKDAFFALRGQKLPKTELAQNDDLRVTPVWDNVKGDKFGFLDYCLAMLPAALKATSWGLVFGSIQLMTSDDLHNFLKITYGVLLLIPAVLTGLVLSIVSWLVDQAKNLVALTITLAISLPLLVPLQLSVQRKKRLGLPEEIQESEYHPMGEVNNDYFSDRHYGPYDKESIAHSLRDSSDESSDSGSPDAKRKIGKRGAQRKLL